MKNNLLLISIILSLAAAFILNSTIIMVLSMVLIYGAIIFKSFNEGLNYVFMLMPLAGIYDDLGFKYLFNISIGVLFIRLIIESIIYKKTIINKITICFIILIVWDFIMTIASGLTNVNFMTNVSLCCSWIIFSLIIFKDDLDLNKILKYLVIGYFLSCFLGMCHVLDTWGFNIPENYRFVGLTRDANYFATYSLIIIFASKKLIVRLVCIVLGLFSTSKMFLLLLLLGLVLTFMYKLIAAIKLNKRFNFEKIKIPMLICIICLILSIVSGLLAMIVDKYIYRFLEYDLTTGRAEIQAEYFTQFISNPISFIFGRGLSYRWYYDVPFSIETNIIAHNTYLDILLSYGILGIGIFIYIVYKIVKAYKSENSKASVLLFIFALLLFALSFLSADLFVFLLFIVILSFKQRNNVDDITLEG